MVSYLKAGGASHHLQTAHDLTCHTFRRQFRGNIGIQHHHHVAFGGKRPVFMLGHRHIINNVERFHVDLFQYLRSKVFECLLVSLGGNLD
ncbi:hypothetical protein ES703_25309 [subsurface metagenome]